jgi:hypothetical protein
MPDDQWQRMSSILCEVARAVPAAEPPCRRERLTTSRVSVAL